MKLPHRRQFLHLAAGAAALTVVSRIARAQAYPVRPVKIVVSFAAGGPTDILGRLTAQWLSERLDQQFVVENRPGGGGNIGAEAVVRSAPDGYTLLMIDATPTINATLYDKLNFDVARDLAAVAAVAQQPQMMIVHPSVPAKTVPEFIAYAKADAGKINMASAGIGTPPHMAGELFKLMAGIDLLHVPYRGTGAAYAVTGSKRLGDLPDIPAVAEFLPGYEASSWFGVCAPKGTPSEIVVKLNQEINAAIGDPKFKSRIGELGATTLPGSPADFGKHIAAEIGKWGKVIRTANIKPD